MIGGRLLYLLRPLYADNIKSNQIHKPLKKMYIVQYQALAGDRVCEL